jgi:hypothetical protein
VRHLLNCAFVGLLAACGAGPVDPPPEDCVWADTPAVQVGADVAVAPVGADDEIGYGNPPQGGAPYSPFQVRVHASWDPEGDLPRWQVHGSATDRATGEEIATGDQPSSFFCSNTGPHMGWLYGGELHLRFWDQALADLAGRTVDLAFTVTLADGSVLSATGGGTLAWTLGLIPDDPPDDTDTVDTDPAP